MTDSDIQIVLALAHGTLSGEAEERARARVAANPELTRELATQVAAIEALDGLPAVMLSAAERSTLRSNLVTQLHLEPAATPAPTPRHTSRWWKPVAGLAAVAVVAVAFIAGPSLLSGSNSAEDVAFVASDGTFGDESTDVVQGGDTGLAESSPFVTSATAGDLGVESLALLEIPQSQVNRLLFLPTETDSVNEDTQKLAGDAAAVGSVDVAVLEDCISSLGDSLPAANLIPLAVTTTESTQVVHLGVGTEGAVTGVISLDLETCRVTSTLP